MLGAGGCWLEAEPPINSRGMGIVVHLSRIALGVVLLLDSVWCLNCPSASILGMFVRWPGGAVLPMGAGAVLGVALIRQWRWPLIIAAVLGTLNTIEYVCLFALPFPLSAPGVMVWIGAAFVRPVKSRLSYLAIPAGLAGVALVVLAFGTTDYRRPAQAIVVFGAAVQSDGTPSLALLDRVKEGVRLYQQGWAPILVMSGGGREPEAMKQTAVRMGVPETAIILDPDGLNTEKTLRNVPYRKILAVSHYYHLARIKHAATRLDLQAYTVPCRMTRRLAEEPYYVARECAAYVAYYLRRY